MPTSKTVATRDENREAVIMGVSSQTITIDGVSYIEGVTPVPIAFDPVTHEMVVEVS